jgi:preprotein translocase subunit Sec61beta
MSSKKKNAPLPASSAGLLRFFEDETRGIKIRPEIVLGITGLLPELIRLLLGYHILSGSDVR